MVLRSCPPAFGLLLDFAPHHAPPSRSGSVAHRAFFAGDECVGWPLERSQGGGSCEARAGGHERKGPPHALVPRADTSKEYFDV
jgi:hypothetical protein